MGFWNRERPAPQDDAEIMTRLVGQWLEALGPAEASAAGERRGVSGELAPEDADRFSRWYAEQVGTFGMAFSADDGLVRNARSKAEYASALERMRTTGEDFPAFMRWRAARGLDPAAPGTPGTAPGGTAGTGTVVVTRARGGYRDLARRYKVLVDETEAGLVGRGGTVRVELGEGEHTVRLAIDWCSSETVRVPVRAGETAHLACAPGGGALDGPRAAVSGSDHYISLWPSSDPASALVVARRKPGPLERVRLAFSAAFVVAAAVTLAAWIWRSTGVAFHADGEVLGAASLTMAGLACVNIALRVLTRRR